MKVAIIQMSDLASEEDYIVKEVRTLARSIVAKVNCCNKVIVVLTGDIIDKGNVSNYEYANTMLENFKSSNYWLG